MWLRWVRVLCNLELLHYLSNASAPLGSLTYHFFKIVYLMCCRIGITSSYRKLIGLLFTRQIVITSR